jgi:hypothetical protein
MDEFPVVGYGLRVYFTCFAGGAGEIRASKRLFMKITFVDVNGSQTTFKGAIHENKIPPAGDENKDWNRQDKAIEPPRRQGRKDKTKAIEPQSHYEITSPPKTNIEPQRRGGRKDKTKAIEPQSHYEITSHPKTNIEPQRRGGRRDQREKRFIYRADTEDTETGGRAFQG